MAGHDAFKAAVEALDPDAMQASLSPDVVFRSPAVYEPYRGLDGTMAVLRAVTKVFQDFRYVDEFTNADGDAVLLFEADVDELQVQGIDILRIGDDGLVSELTVMVRPYHGLERLLQRVGEQLAAAAG